MPFSYFHAISPHLKEVSKAIASPSFVSYFSSSFDQFGQNTRWYRLPTLTLCISKHSRNSRNLRHLSVHFKGSCSAYFHHANLTVFRCIRTNQKKITTYGVQIQMICQGNDQKGDFQLNSFRSLCRKKTKKCDNMTLIFHLFAYKTFLYLSIICHYPRSMISCLVNHKSRSNKYWKHVCSFPRRGTKLRKGHIRRKRQ